jgi:hypothetical protein
MHPRTTDLLAWKRAVPAPTLRAVEPLTPEQARWLDLHMVERSLQFFSVTVAAAALVALFALCTQLDAHGHIPSMARVRQLPVLGRLVQWVDPVHAPPRFTVSVRTEPLPPAPR